MYALAVCASLLSLFSLCSHTCDICRRLLIILALIFLLLFSVTAA